MRLAPLAAALLAFGLSPTLLADVVTDWNDKACAITGKLGPGAPGHRAMAFVQVAVFEAVNSIEPRYAPYMQRIPASPGASVDAAVAAANRAVPAKWMAGVSARPAPSPSARVNPSASMVCQPRDSPRRSSRLKL